MNSRHALPQPSAKKDKTYLSSRTTYRFDCAQRRMAMKVVRTYAGSELLDYVCGRSPGG